MPPSPRKLQKTLIEEEMTPVTAMTLTSTNHSSKVMKGLQELRHCDVLCDYCLKAETITINVHRAVLAACSDYFRVMLTNDMRESRESSVELKGVSACGLRIVIDFAYTGVLELNTENVEDVLSAATHLQISDAVDLCSRYLEACLTVENCVSILNLAELYALQSTREIARMFILKNFEKISESEYFHKLTHAQLSYLLEENCLKVASEYNLFTIILQWINFNLAEREPYVADLMKNIRLPLLSGEELVEKVSRVPIMKQNRDCSELLMEAKDYHIVVSKQPLLQGNRTQVRSEKRSLVMCHGDNLESYTFSNKRHSYLKDTMVPLYNPSVVVVDNFMYACGGKYDSNENNEIATARCFRYDPRFDTWYELAPMNEPRKDFVLIALNRKLYAIAGQDENKVMYTVECFNIATNEWELSTPLGEYVYGHAGSSCCNKIFVSGGQTFRGCTNKVVCYQPDSDFWEEREPMVHKRLNHIMMSVNKMLYVIGGNIEDSYGFPVPVISIEQYNPHANQWTVCQGSINIREAGACVLDDKIYVVGGINGEHYYSDLVQEFDPKKDEVEIVQRFSTRIYGRACCILTLPNYF